MPSFYNGIGGNVTVPTTNTVIGATNATPIVIQTNTPHGYFTGDTVVVFFVAGNTAANSSPNNPWMITVIDATHFSLNGSSGNGAFSGDGLCYDANLLPPFQIPSDGDTFNAAAFNVGYQALADRTQFLQLNVPQFTLINYYLTGVGDDSWASWLSGTSTNGVWTNPAGGQIINFSFFPPVPVCNAGDQFLITANAVGSCGTGNLGVAPGFTCPGVFANALQVPAGSATLFTNGASNAPWIANTFYQVDSGGINASLSNPVGGLQTVTGLSGMSAGMVGASLKIGNFLAPPANPANAGVFTITNYISATSVKIANAAGSSDPNNGSIGWEGFNMPFNFWTAVYGVGAASTYNFVGHREMIVYHYRSPYGVVL